MDAHKAFTLFIAMAILGAMRAGKAQYRLWKADRMSLLPEVRNAGFWTDTRLVIMERALWWSYAAIMAVTVISAGLLVTAVLWYDQISPYF